MLQECQERYPKIFPLAMDILPIPGSAVPCERVFSSGKETMTPRRNRIAPELMEALQLLKFSIKKGKGLDFTQGMDWADELKELEFTAEFQQQCPEDPKAFVRTLTESRKL
jgi:hypothetical protein